MAFLLLLAKIKPRLEGWPESLMRPNVEITGASVEITGASFEITGASIEVRF